MKKNLYLIQSRHKGVIKAQTGTPIDPYVKTKDTYSQTIQNPTELTLQKQELPQQGTQYSSVSPAAIQAGAAGAGAVGATGGSLLTQSGQNQMEAGYGADSRGVMTIDEESIMKGSKRAGTGKGLSIGSGAIGVGASIGGAIGTAIPVPVLGTVSGAAIGALAGALVAGGSALIGRWKGKKNAEEEINNAKEIQAQQEAAWKSDQAATQRQSARQRDVMAAQALMAKKGIKVFKSGGKLETPDSVNIVPKGKLHKENNNLGNKDKGIPVIDRGTNKKKYEIEKEELILRRTATKKVEDMVVKYKESNNEEDLISIGKYMAEELMSNTHDYSGRFGVKIDNDES